MPFRLPFWPTLVVLGALLGLAAGLMAGGLWPETPLHAVASDRTENFVLATGPVDGNCEAVYFLDGLSGTLNAGVLSNVTRSFQARYTASVASDLVKAIKFLNKNIQAGGSSSRHGAAPPPPEIELPRNPHFLMVTGNVDIRRGLAGREKPSLAAIYVAETSTGIVIAYLLPWDTSSHSANMPVQGQLIPQAFNQFSAPVIAAGG
jgi:hypothetical protein